ncbi:MAG: hypothetical protein KAU62_14625 [Candidatus Heimdallarchaeota archaeon]|nr:hypothetical protein [Candidatus Heimdallarchaeota archaeon]MCK4612386.1 hypothetical protein [Candidatus Heimdallarchaeota archaeon]
MNEMEIENYSKKIYGKMDLTVKATCDCGNPLIAIGTMEEMEYTPKRYHHNFFFDCKKCKRTFATMFEFSHNMQPYKQVLLGQNLSENEEREKYDEWVEETYHKWDESIKGDN